MRIPLPATLAALVACGPVAPSPMGPDPSLDTRRGEPWRPQVHVSAETGWLSDPNGLFWLDGTAHLFFQHDPSGPQWGAMHWGHATSPDLVRWTELPVALAPDPVLGAAFSGSAVVDAVGDSAPCAGVPCPVLALTHDGGDDRAQKQSLAVTTDGGTTWRVTDDSPVVPNPGLRDFRDPRLLRYGDGWRMLLAAGDGIQVLASDDLATWTLRSTFTPEADVGGTLEMPELLRFPDGAGGERVWLVAGVLTRLLGPSHVVAWPGTFDGDHFVADDPGAPPEPVERGDDLYAAQAWSAQPDGTVTWTAWASDWRYATTTPTFGTARGMLVIPRVVEPATDGVHLRQRPIDALEVLWRDVWRADDLTVRGEVALDGAHGRALDVLVEVDDDAPVALSLRGGQVVVRLDPVEGLSVEREVGDGGFLPDEPVVDGGPLPPFRGTRRLRVVLDWSSVEVFVDDGEAVLTALVFPERDDDGVALIGDDARVRRVEVRALASIWAP